MSFMLILKLLPYIIAGTGAVSAVIYVLVLRKQNRSMRSDIESLTASLETQSIFIKRIKENIEINRAHVEAINNNKVENDKLLEDIKDAKTTKELLDIINNTLQLPNSD